MRKKIIITISLLLLGSRLYAEEKYIYNIDEVAKNTKDIIIFPHIGFGSPLNLNLGIDALIVDMKYLPLAYLEAGVELGNLIGLDYNAKAGITFGRYVNEEQKIVVKSYSAGYNVTVNEYIPVYIPVYKAFHIHGMVDQEQMPAYINSYGSIDNTSLTPKKSDNGTFFLGGGIGFYSAYDYKVTVDKGSSYHKQIVANAYKNFNLNVLYAPTGLYKGFATSIEYTVHGNYLSFKMEGLFSFRKDNLLDGLGRNFLLKLTIGGNFGYKTKSSPTFNLECTVTGKPMNECK